MNNHLQNIINEFEKDFNKKFGFGIWRTSSKNAASEDIINGDIFSSDILEFSKSFLLKSCQEYTDSIIDEIVPKEKEFKGWHTAHSTEDFVDLSERYSFNQAIQQIKSNYNKLKGE